MGSLFCCLRGPTIDEEHEDSDDNEPIQGSDATNNSNAHARSALYDFIIRCDGLLGRGALTSMPVSYFPMDGRGLDHSRVKPQLDLQSKAFVSQISVPVEDCAISEYDECLICLEEYTYENPRIETKCSHHFHLSCMLEWQQRNKFCPVCCSTVLEFEEMS